MSATTYTFSYGSANPAGGSAANPSGGDWDNTSNWGTIGVSGTTTVVGTIALGSDLVAGGESGLAPTDSVVLPSSSTPYTTYIDEFGTDDVDSATIGNSATVALDPNANTGDFIFRGTIDIQAGAVLDMDGVANSSGPMDISYGDSIYSVPNDTAVPNSGTIFVDGVLYGAGAIESNVAIVTGAGSIISAPDLYGDSGMVINANLGGNLTLISQNGGKFQLGGSVASSVMFDATGATGAVELDQSDTFSGTIAGLSVDRNAGDLSTLAAGVLPSDVQTYIDLVGVSNGQGAGSFDGIAAVTGATYHPNAGNPTAGGVLEVTLTLAGGSSETINLNVSGNYTHGLSNSPDAVSIVSDGGHNSTGGASGGGFDGFDLVFTDFTTCFLPGSRILTPSGEVPVEALHVGDDVVTVEGGKRSAKPIKWIGYRKLTLNDKAIESGASPSRFKRGSMADGLPSRDLIVSPPHCMFLEGKLIPAKLLVNDMSIVREDSLATVEYYHVELERHSVLIANGVETESYLDTGNRAFFSNAGVALMLHPEFNVNAGLKQWETDACAPLVVDAEAVLPVWQALADRAVALGYEAPEYVTTNDPDVHLIVDGRRVDSVAVRDRVHTFLVPAGAGSVVLASRSVAQNVLRPYVDDPRQVGVAVRRISVRQGEHRVDYAADHPELNDGWHAPDKVAIGMWRWTKGRGVLPVRSTTSPAVIEVTLSHIITYVVGRERVGGRLAA